MVMQSPPRSLPLAVRSNQGKYGQTGTARLVNLYAEDAGADAKVQFPLLASPGLRLWVSLSTGAVRGLFKVDDTLAMIVCGTDIITVDVLGTWRVVGGIPGTGKCYFARNRRPSGTQVAIVSEGAKRCYDVVAETLDVITDADLPDAIGCDALSAYVLYFIEDGRVFYSDINDAMSVAALSFIEAEGQPDGLTGGIVLEDKVWLFGKSSIEVWGLTDNADAPLARVGGATIEQGCIAQASITKVQTPEGTQIAWVANDLTIRMSGSATGNKISSHDVDRAVKSCADPSSIEAFSYNFEGHVFVQFNCAEWTWVYDATTGLWHEEKTYGLTRRKSSYMMDFSGKTLVGAFDAAVVYEIASSAMDDDGQPLVCEVFTPIDHAFPNDVEYNALYIDTLAGTGITGGTNDIANPRIGVRWSFDGGKNFGNWRVLETGKSGKHRQRASTFQLGTSSEDGACFHIQWAAAVARAITGAAVDSTIVRA